MNRFVFRIIYIWTVIGLVISAVLSGCSADSNQRMLTVSIEPQQYLLEKIVGDKWEVNALLTKGADPESFDPPMSAMKTAIRGAAYFKLGHTAFEDALIPRLSLANGDTMMVIDTSVGIPLIAGGHGHDSEDHDSHCHHHDFDPHIWSSVKNAKIMAENMLQGVITLDPSNEKYYRDNFNKLICSLDSLDTAIREITGRKEGASFITWHPSLTYYAQEYGLNQISLGSENKEMSADMFRNKIEEAQRNHAVAFLVQPEYDQDRSRDIAGQAGAKTVSINLLEHDWPGEMLRVAHAVVGDSL